MPVYKRGNHYWFRVQINGKEHRESCRGATHEQAKALEAKFRQDLINETLGITNYSLEDALARWLDGEARDLEDYEHLLNIVRLILPLLQDTPIVKAQDAARRIREEYAHLAPATVNRRLSVLRRIVNLSWEWGWIKSPIKIKMQPGEVSRHNYLTISQVFRLARYARKSRWHIILAAFSGMREGEILGIDDDMDLGYAIALKKTKNRKPRLVPLNRIARIAMNNLNPDVTYSVLRRDFEYSRELSGLDDIWFHDLRHTAASFMMNGGASMGAIRDMLGHSNLSVTSRYSHLGINELADAANKMVNRTKTAQSKNNTKLRAA